MSTCKVQFPFTNSLTRILAVLTCALGLPFALAVTDPRNGDWDAEHVTLHNTAEAELMVRVGSINNVGFGFPEGINPFTAGDMWGHSYPWEAPEGAADGTDRIMLGSSYEGNRQDGYSGIWDADPEAATTRPIVLEFDTAELTVRNALLQIVIDDFQPTLWGSVFTATLNGEDAPYIAEVVNNVDQTGPVVQIISIEIPDVALPEIASGSVSIQFDETTGAGDGFAIDFVKLLVNYGRTEFVSQIEGTVYSESGEPFPGATVRVLGTSNVQVTDEDGEYRAEVVSGLNAVRASHAGYLEDYDFRITPAGELVAMPGLTLRPGAETPDLNYEYFAAGGGWERASQWATSELSRAAELNLIPDRLMTADLTLPISRAEFAGVVVGTWEHLADEAAVVAAVDPFEDTDDSDVLKAFNEDLAVGISDVLFDPDALLNREQAATMLTRVVKKLAFPGWTYATDSEYALEFPEIEPFADDQLIAPWARDSVYFMVANGIISGLDDDAFRPQGATDADDATGLASTTREQALVLALRLVEHLE